MLQLLCSCDGDAYIWARVLCYVEKELDRQTDG